MKSPDDIKKGLECCQGRLECECCPYQTECDLPFGDIVEADALAYIKQLEQRLAQAARERDAAVRDVETLCLAEDFNGDYCEYCKHKEPDGGCHHECMPYHECGWQWRGVCEENSKEGRGQ